MQHPPREQRIINVLLIFCLAVGFACFSLIVLPNHLKKGGVFPSPNVQATPQNISQIVNLTQDSSKPTPLSPYILSPQDVKADHDTDRASEHPVSDLSQAAGGAGAAIEETGFEARQTYENQPEVASQAPVIPRVADTNTQGRRTFPPSSIAKGEMSTLDNPKTIREKGWLIVPEGLEQDVAFWRDVYAKYDHNNVILHHPRYLGIIYDVVNLADIENDPRLTDVEKEHLKQKRVDERKKEITDILLTLSTGRPSSTLTDSEWQIKQLFRGIDEPEKFRRASVDDGVRAQTGQKDKFIAGLKYSGRYLGEVESIFESYGLPRELTRLIFVESMFNPRAVSSVGASGVWQFMRATGKLYMQINDLVDERNDPITATHAAARLLRHNYDYLGSWPLAINAYNTGRGRISQAIAAVGTKDIGAIIKGFAHPAYGFASRNFFPEFLAALDVAEHAEKYFGPISWDEPLRFETVKTGYNISLPSVANTAGMSLNEILELNQGLTSKVASGTRLIPAGYQVKLPLGKAEVFLASAARAPGSRLGPVHHVVEDGESLATVADFYGVTQEALIASNKLISRRLKPGQTLVVPVKH